MLTQKSPDCHRNLSKQPPKRPATIENRANDDGISTLLSPGFKSVAAMAGWDEEALLMATLIVADTPDRSSSDKRGHSGSSGSKRKRRARRQGKDSIPIVALNLDEEETVIDRCGPPEKKKKGSQADESTVRSEDVSPEKCSSSFNPLHSCMERLREELCCAICLEMCFEPTTTPCGHSFCKKCLRSAADRCGQRCPKCRQQISKIRSCTINTVLWNTIQLLFPGEVEARKKAASKFELNQDVENEIHKTAHQHDINERVRRTPRRASIATSSSSIRRVGIPSQDDNEGVSLGSISLPSQDQDAALALRLQRREFMGVVRRSTERNSSRSILLARSNLRAMASTERNNSSSVLLARSNLRAMASHAINFRARSRNLQL
ncbi:hypothetical protein Droror1_Dr00001035 [Drosera rotundifolia]